MFCSKEVVFRADPSVMDLPEGLQAVPSAFLNPSERRSPSNPSGIPGTPANLESPEHNGIWVMQNSWEATGAALTAADVKTDSGRLIQGL